MSSVAASVAAFLPALLLGSASWYTERVPAQAHAHFWLSVAAILAACGAASFVIFRHALPGNRSTKAAAPGNSDDEAPVAAAPKAEDEDRDPTMTIVGAILLAGVVMCSTVGVHHYSKLRDLQQQIENLRVTLETKHKIPRDKQPQLDD